MTATYISTSVSLHHTELYRRGRIRFAASVLSRDGRRVTCRIRRVATALLLRFATAVLVAPAVFATRRAVTRLFGRSFVHSLQKAAQDRRM